ncbi:MAG: hypothetical protein AB7V04_06720 [Desulfomonilaceae bacterium]
MSYQIRKLVKINSINGLSNLKCWSWFATLILVFLIWFEPCACCDDGLTAYTDPKGRFSIDYPSTMTLNAASVDDLSIVHPSASLRIDVDVIQRPKKASRDTVAFLNVLKKGLKEEFPDAQILGEGQSATDPKQLYLICSFTDKRGVKLVQLVQVYLADERILQLIISDRSAGFKNLESLITRISNSLKIFKPSLM